jgi:D-alanyl-D-alanine carboxypeptidase
LPDSAQVTTARDMAILGRALQGDFPRSFSYFRTKSFRWNGKTYPNHNKLLGRVEGVNGIKTGYTRASGFNLVCSAKRGRSEIIAVVLGGSSGAARDARMTALLEEYLPPVSTGWRLFQR